MKIILNLNVFAQKNKYPWMVTFVSPDGSQWLGCGGTLVASKYVISAAHCMFTDQAQTIPVTTDQIKVSFSLTKKFRVKLITR